MTARQRALTSKYKEIIRILGAMSQAERDEIVASLDNATPEQQAKAMTNAGPEGEEFGRAFEDTKGVPA